MFTPNQGRGLLPAREGDPVTGFGLLLAVAWSVIITIAFLYRGR
jgi:hypothetical protein